MLGSSLFSGTARRMRALAEILLRNYEPQKHYLRGRPGPATMAKLAKPNGGDSPRSIPPGAPTKIASGLQPR